MPVNYRSEENGMTTLKCLLEHHYDTELTPPLNTEKRDVTKEDDLIDLFPLPRYFQVHFEHIHDNSQDVQSKLKHLNHDIQNQLDQLKQTLATVEEKLDRFIAILGHPIEPRQ